MWDRSSAAGRHLQSPEVLGREPFPASAWILTGSFRSSEERSYIHHSLVMFISHSNCEAVVVYIFSPGVDHPWSTALRAARGWSWRFPGNGLENLGSGDVAVQQRVYILNLTVSSPGSANELCRSQPGWKHFLTERVCALHCVINNLTIELKSFERVFW